MRSWQVLLEICLSDLQILCDQSWHPRHDTQFQHPYNVMDAMMVMKSFHASIAFSLIALNPLTLTTDANLLA